ncbi:MAG: hypothetical protein MI867_00525 [Pseudomonadales bacterium]|nr:hypothetical protein [Pseudomonadales bacterium]
MSTTIDVETVKQKVIEMVRQAAITRVGDHSRLDGFELLELSDTRAAGEVLGNWMSIILVTGDAIRITLKLHFSSSDAKAVSHVVYGEDSPNGVSDAKAEDFVKELSNLMAGYIVKTFEGMNIPMGISLPLCTRGFYEVFADYVPTESPLIRFSDLWRLEYKNRAISGTVMIEISNPNALDALCDFDLDQDDDDDSEFDFL